MQIKPIRDDLEKYLKKQNLEKKYKKAKKLFEQDPFYPSLNTELLEPKDKLILVKQQKQKLMFKKI